LTLRRTSRLALALAAGSLSLTACYSDAGQGNVATADEGLTGALAGAGSSAQSAAMQTWIAGFQSSNPDVTVNYDPVGSGGGREQFTAGGIEFAGSDRAMKPEEITAAAKRCPGGTVVNLPLYISPIAVAFNLEGIDELNLKPATIAKIFNQKIQKWNDPAIAADNAGVTLPDLEITPVNRQDDSGTTENFTDYLAATAAADWPYEPDGVFPVKGGEAANGTSGVIQAITAGNGAIGYADASQVGELGTVAVGVGNEFVQYSPEAAAAVVEGSPREEGRQEGDIVVELERGTTAGGEYPVVLVSYSLACTTYEDEGKAELVQAFLSYIASADGQQAAAEAAGSAPISSALRTEVLASIEKIGAS
jgi:phosphate transport system substrate-binding protein